MRWFWYDLKANLHLSFKLWYRLVKNIIVAKQKFHHSIDNYQTISSFENPIIEEWNKTEEEGKIKRNKTHYVNISFLYTEKSTERFHYLIASCAGALNFFYTEWSCTSKSYRRIPCEVPNTLQDRGYTSRQASILRLWKIITSSALPLARFGW